MVDQVMEDHRGQSFGGCGHLLVLGGGGGGGGFCWLGRARHISKWLDYANNYLVGTQLQALTSSHKSLSPFLPALPCHASSCLLLPSPPPQVRQQHLSTDLAFLTTELKVADEKVARDRVFFISAKEVGDHTTTLSHHYIVTHHL